jgi:HD-like signal output (HDOD) protein
MAGLLHDLGRLVLATYSPERYEDVLRHRAQNDCYLLDAERTMLGVDHMMAGSALAAHWKFPLLMQKAIATHHAPDSREPGSLAAIVHLSDCIVHALDLSDDEHDLVPPVFAPVWKAVNLKPEQLRRVYRETEIQFEEACQILVMSS